jgi:hypothetical protein
MNMDFSDKLFKPKKEAWPTKAAMSQVYDLGLWGSNNDAFYSGEGSHKKDIVEPYILAVKAFLNTFSTPQIICDLGCGDFNIGKQLVSYSEHYIAIDIVPELISYNKSKFQLKNLEFRCLDIAEDDLPEADVIVLRQVLQHLSNDEIIPLVKKLKRYKYIILTEHLPEGAFIPNKNIISGQGIRLKKQSGVNLLKAPFNMDILNHKELSRINLGPKKGVILTVLYQLV